MVGYSLPCSLILETRMEWCGNEEKTHRRVYRKAGIRWVVYIMVV